MSQHITCYYMLMNNVNLMHLTKCFCDLNFGSLQKKKNEKNF